MSIRACCVHCGTGAIAPPGAARVTPTAPSYVGPRLLHVYCCPCSNEHLQAKRCRVDPPRPHRHSYQVCESTSPCTQYKAS